MIIELIQIITQTKKPNTFRVFWRNDKKTVANSTINLDFTPLIDYVKKHYDFKKYCLVHWQARPRGLRRWGIYDNESAKYYSADSYITDANCKSFTIQLDENRLNTLPTAVICYPEATITTATDNKIVISPFSE